VALNVFRTKTLSLTLFWRKEMPCRALLNNFGEQIGEVRQLVSFGVTDNMSHKTYYIGFWRFEVHFNIRPDGYVPRWLDEEMQREKLVVLSDFRRNRCQKK